MLSYQHSYHAGNFADVVKHITLLQILDYLVQKEKPLFYLETHAGQGSYDLSHAHALKTAESQHGIQLLWQYPDMSPVLAPYLHYIQSLNRDGNLRYYPGSPQIAIDHLRAQDRLFLCEKHPHTFQSLRQLPNQGRRVFCSQTDGLSQLKAQLPPQEKRGLIFIDPSFEIKTEYQAIPDAIASAYHRFSTGVYCIWYPILPNQPHIALQQKLALVAPNNHLCVDFYLTDEPQKGMYGCGLWIINPPYMLQAELSQILPILCHILNPGFAKFQIET